MTARKDLIHGVADLVDAEMAAALGHYVNAACGYRWIPTRFGDECEGLSYCLECYPQKRSDGRSKRRKAHHEPARPHYVYRCYDASDRLIYVGCTNNPVARLAQHASTSWWWAAGIERTRLTVFPDRRYALSKEREAIANEMPKCNVKGRWAYRTDLWTAEDYVDFRTAIVSAVNSTHGIYGTKTSQILREVDEELERRFGIAAISRRPA